MVANYELLMENLQKTKKNVLSDCVKAYLFRRREQLRMYFQPLAFLVVNHGGKLRALKGRLA